MRTKISLLTAFVFFLVAFSKAQEPVLGNGISPKFSTSKGVLLVQRPKNKAVGRILEKRFGKFYHGEFQMVEFDDDNAASMGSSKDFPLVVKMIHVIERSNDPDKWILEMTDRVTGERFSTKWFLGNTLPVYSRINSYAKELEELRAK